MSSEATEEDRSSGCKVSWWEQEPLMTCDMERRATPEEPTHRRDSASVGDKV